MAASEAARIIVTQAMSETTLTSSNKEDNTVIVDTHKSSPSTRERIIDTITEKDEVLGAAIKDTTDAMNSANQKTVAAVKAKQYTEKATKAELEQQVTTLTQQMTELSLTNAIANKIVVASKVNGASQSEKTLAEAYCKQTFGDQSFMDTMSTAIRSSINTMIETEEQNYIDRTNSKLNTTAVVDSVGITFNASTTRTIEKLDVTTKLDIVKNLNDKILNVSNLTALNEKLSSTALGNLLKPTINDVLAKAVLHADGLISNVNFVKIIQEKQNLVLQQETVFNNFVLKAKHDELIVKQTIEEWKQKQYAVAQAYANRIISTISDSIISSVKGAISGWIKKT